MRHSEIPRLLEASGGGIAVPPDDLGAFVTALRDLVDAPERAAALGRSGRRWAVDSASPSAVGAAYARLIASIT